MVHPAQSNNPDATLAVEPRAGYSKPSRDWKIPRISEAVAGKIRIVNDTRQPQSIHRHDHMC